MILTNLWSGGHITDVPGVAVLQIGAVCLTIMLVVVEEEAPPSLSVTVSLKDRVVSLLTIGALNDAIAVLVCC